MDAPGAVLALTADELGADASSARRARRWVSDFLSPCDAPSRVDPEVLDDLLLVVSELVTNVVLHTHGPPTLSLRVEPDRTVRVEVADCDDTIPVVVSGPARWRAPDLIASEVIAPGDPAPGGLAPGPGAEDRIGGHGLWIVSLLASRWGIEPRRSGGKTVWAVFRAASANGSAHQRSYR